MNSSTAQASRSVSNGAKTYVARVLVVEPRPMTSPMLRRWLERRGHTLDLANGAESGFQQAVVAPPDVVLIDLGLTAGSGFALANRLRIDPITRTVPLVAVGDATTAVPERAKTLFARHVLKPIDVDELGVVLVDAAMRPRENVAAVNKAAGLIGGY